MIETHEQTHDFHHDSSDDPPPQAAQLLQQSQAPLTAMLWALSPGGAATPEIRYEKAMKVIQNHGKSPESE